MIPCYLELRIDFSKSIGLSRLMIYPTELFSGEKGGEQGADNVLEYEQSEKETCVVAKSFIFH